MKKYRLKEEAKKFLTDNLNAHIGEVIQTLEDWESVNFCIEALEEVEDRIELEFMYSEDGENKDKRWLSKCGESSECFKNGFTDQEKELCEKALNGELFTKDDLYQFSQNCLNKCYPEYFSRDLLDATFEEYLNQKK